MFKKKSAVLSQQVPECILLNRFIWWLGAFPVASSLFQTFHQSSELLKDLINLRNGFPQVELQHL